MDSYEFNKIAGAVLAVIFLMFGGSILAEGIFHSEAPETPGYEIAVAEPDESGGEGGDDAGTAVAPIAVRMQEASAEDGVAQFRRCQACHSDTPDGADRVGPGLYNVVNRPIASHEGFGYSPAMSGFSEGGSVVWDYEHLDHFLEDPDGYVPGTTMGFAGIANPDERADAIAYLRSLSEDPAPLPEVTAEEETADAGGAEDGADVTDAGATTQPAEGDDQMQAQAPGTTEPDTGTELPGQEQAPVVADGGADASTETADGEAAQAENGGEGAAPSEDGGATQVAGDPAAGESVFRRCQACHAVGEGATNRIGPELNGIMTEAPAAVEGYNFSSAFQEWAAGQGQWDHELMSEWLSNPRATVPGTSMSFPGLSNQEDIDNVIAYLAQFAEDGTQSGN